ncbi:MAG: cytochrome c [Bauldia sp.]|nr:cytochrome c [Bauldia sp.]
MSKLEYRVGAAGKRLRRGLFFSLAMFGGALGLSGFAAAQTDGGALWAEGACFNCHGNLAAGDGDSAYPSGPNLRRSALDRESLREVVACGLPSSPMPANLEGAYTQTACFGMPVGPAPDIAIGAGFSAEEIDTLVDFLMANVVGVTRITRENCALFFGGNLNAPTCLEY